jgi:ribosomal protein S24E
MREEETLEILSRYEKPLLKRFEIDFLIKDLDKPLTRKEAIELLSKKLGIDIDRIVLVKIENIFGKSEMKGHCHIYNTPEDKNRFEQKHILERNKKALEIKKEGEKK